MQPCNQIQSVKTVAQQKQKLMRKDVWNLAASWQKLRLIVHWWLPCAESSPSLLPLFISKSAQGRFKGSSFLFAPFQVGFDVLKPQAVEVFRDRHVNKPESPMDLVSIEKQISWCGFILISFGFPTNELVGI